jgi:uncharacterized protein YndB with AHSA1/START domain
MFWVAIALTCIAGLGILLLLPFVTAVSRVEMRPLTERVTIDVAAPREMVWRAVWSETRFLGPIQHIDDAQAGDVLDYEQIALEGRLAAITRIEARILELEPARRIKELLLRQDGEPFFGGEGSWDALSLEDAADGTRVTIELHGTRYVPMQRYLMRKALGIEAQKLLRRVAKLAAPADAA